jgi:hypothetical protein
MRRQSRRSFHHSDTVLHRLLHLLEGTHAYLAHALARDAELVRELLERDRFFGEPARLEECSARVRRRFLSSLHSKPQACLHLITWRVGPEAQ